MPLNANRWTEEILETFDQPFAYCEAIETVLIKSGWHDDPATGEAVLVYREQIARNQYGSVIRRDVESRDYELAGAPPVREVRETYSSGIFVPGLGRSEPGSPRLMEEEIIEYFPWSQFQPGSPNLSRRRTLSGWVFYEGRRSSDPFSATAEAKLQASGRNPVGDEDVQVDTARIWSEANHLGSVVEEESANQVAKWVEPIETEIETVFEEVDKYTIYTTTQNHLRPGDIRRSGPSHQRKENYQYRLGVSIDAPKLRAYNTGDDGIRLEATGGGATVPQGQRVKPEKYKFMRRTISAPDRSASGDPFGLYDSDPAAPTINRLFVNTSVTDLNGAPASATPSQTSYTEPGDIDPDDDYATGWRVVAEVDNSHGPRDDGSAITVDGDVQSTAVYEYAAVAIIRSDESALSNLEQVTYNGADRSSSITAFARRRDDGTIEVDVTAPDDPNLPAEDYGEPLIYDLPADIDDFDDLEDLCIDLARGHFVDDRAAGIEVDATLNIPILTLVRGQRITLPQTEWNTTGNGLVMTSETPEKDWELDGFRISATRSANGEINHDSTLYLKDI